MVECVALDRFRGANAESGYERVQILLLLGRDIILRARSRRFGLERQRFVARRGWCRVPSACKMYENAVQM